MEKIATVENHVDKTVDEPLMIETREGKSARKEHNL